MNPNSAKLESFNGKIQSGKLFMYRRNKAKILRNWAMDTDTLYKQIRDDLLFIDRLKQLDAITDTII